MVALLYISIRDVMIIASKLGQFILGNHQKLSNFREHLPFILDFVVARADLGTQHFMLGYKI